ncbi:unnamed protein product [Symbiodinium pilosum]|uniref:Uncharacterized protein n=1 Tax=Symbiodinium pilosum TaxID=2952 RepID=A0A812WYI6_SYMPI|nr:unnamed protein product [Symbiodinium pilosum]
MEGFSQHMGLMDYLPRSRDQANSSPSQQIPEVISPMAGQISLFGSYASEGPAKLDVSMDRQDEVLDCRLEHAALVARQLRLQAAEQEASREAITVQLRLAALREEVLQEQKRQEFLQAALQRAQAGGAALQMASAMTCQRQEAALGARSQLLAGKPLVSSLECQASASGATRDPIRAGG